MKMAAECCNVLKGIISSVLGFGSASTSGDFVSDARPVEYVTLDDDSSAAHQEESANYQLIIDHAMNGFITAKSKGKADVLVGQKSTSVDHIDKLRQKLKNALLYDLPQNHSLEPGKRSQATRSNESSSIDAYSESLDKFHFITNFSTEAAR